jgi:luciferase family oxidoreductase group 1
LELQAFLQGRSKIPGVTAVPGAGTNVPLYILGSSLFGARVAAAFGLPYGFASHFAPAALVDAVRLYRDEFRPSAQLAAPYVIAGVNVIAAPTEEDAAEQHRDVRRRRVERFLTAGRRLSDEEADTILESPQGRQIARMMQYTAVGTDEQVRAYLADFAASVDADELMTVHPSPTMAQRLASIELTTELTLRSVDGGGEPVADVGEDVVDAG